jgi:ROS/MUCR transcriptional regulator protein
VLGHLNDGTPYFSPIGQVIADDSHVACHLCGRAFKSVAAHLASHGWTKVEYCQAFGLERSQSLEGAETRKLRATAFSARLVFESAVRAGSARGHQRARTGELSRDAANAARGRPFPAQRRERSRSAVSPLAEARIASANRDRADQHLAAVAHEAALQQDYATIGGLVRDKLGAGYSLAAISRSCGLDKDWMARHLHRIDPSAADLARSGSQRALDARWLPVVRSLGFDDVVSYLRQRHLVDHASVNAIAREAGVSFQAAKSALQRHAVAVSPHMTKRRGAELRRQEAAIALGAPTIADYVRSRRTLGWTWREIASESGQPQTWLRRQAG